MSTHALVIFTDVSGHEATVYRHHDGYPEGPNGVLAHLSKVVQQVNRRPFPPSAEDAGYAFIGLGHTAEFVENPGSQEHTYRCNLETRTVSYVCAWQDGTKTFDLLGGQVLRDVAEAEAEFDRRINAQRRRAFEAAVQRPF